MSESITDLPAERATLGALILHPALIAEAFAVAPPSAFYGPHLDLAVLLADMAEHGQPIDPQTVLAEVMRRGLVGRLDGPYLHTLIERAWNPENVLAYAAEVARAAHRRTLREIGLRAVQVAESDTTDLGLACMDTLTAAEELSERIAAKRVQEPSQTLADFLAVQSEYDWLVPGLLERGDRMMVTGWEGLGKSTWLRQVAVCVAAGLHPFTGAPVEPKRVLYVDLENGPAHLRRSYAPLVALAERHGQGVADRFRIVVRPAGIDVADPDDAAWLLGKATTNRPDLLVIGPLYRMHAAEVSKEEPARQIVGAVDRCRAAVGCAVLMEAHAGHGDSFRGRGIRPAGSSLFMRWPEFGYGIKPGRNNDRERVRLMPWRGDRDAREWPSYLRRGVKGAWPWVVDTESELRDKREREAAWDQEAS